jgi:hypothetical protein
MQVLKIVLGDDLLRLISGPEPRPHFYIEK